LKDSLLKVLSKTTPCKYSVLATGTPKKHMCHVKFYNKLATVNQHPPTHHEGWMISGQETIFCGVPVP
jgi:hypothetical protein